MGRRDENGANPPQPVLNNVEYSDTGTRIHISSQPNTPVYTSKASNSIWPDHELDGKSNYLRERDDEESEEDEITGPMRYVAVAQDHVRALLKRNTSLLKSAVLLLILVAYHVFLGFAIAHDFDKAFGVCGLTVVAWLLVFYYKVLIPLLADRFNSVQPSISDFFSRLWRNLLVRIGFYSMLLIAIATFLILDTASARHRLVGLCGMGFFFVFMFVFSRNPTKVGLMVLRWEYGSKKFNQLSELVLTFMDFSKNGTDFVYGFLSAPPNICGMDPVFAFQAIQVVVYFGSVVALLYYYGIMQSLLRKMAWIMQITLGTTATESLNACACIFLGMSEAPLLIRPYLDRMTASELHAIMTTGFSCIAGAVFATYISFGACPRYLLSATMMSAPGSLACSKILYPETEQSQLTRVEDLELPEGEESNALECISNGAVMAVELVLAIVANLIVFLALLALLDNVIGYMGELIGQNGWSFELMLGYLFFPLAYIMGVNENTAETFRVAQLMGTKTALNEFIAYKQLGKMVDDNHLSVRWHISAPIKTNKFSVIQYYLATLSNDWYEYLNTFLLD